MKSNSTNSRLGSVVLWSVISAAFIGPGTITTAVTAGSSYQTALLWATVFSTVACLMLQEISARIAIVSGMTFGEAIEKKFGHRSGRVLKFAIGGTVVLGCAAYEAGNILGAVSGLSLLIPGNIRLYTLVIVLVAVSVLWTGKRKVISLLMTLLVTLMGVAFIMLASRTNVSFPDLIGGAFSPNIPLGAELITLGLVGTTIVPYNLFLSSGISRGQTVPLMRIGLTISVLVGGAITAFILVAGTLVPSFSTFTELADAFEKTVGKTGALALGLGLFAAGFSSTITAPYAASVIGSSVFGIANENKNRLIWGAVVLTGFAIGFSGIKPVPVILTVQALNGLILPLVTAYLILVVNDQKIVTTGHRPSKVYNILLLVVFASVLMIGLNNVDKSISTAMNLGDSHLGVVATTSFAIVALVAYSIFKKKETP